VTRNANDPEMTSNPKKSSTREPRRKAVTQRMKKYSGKFIAESFLEYYRQRGHTICPSAPLVPDDPTLLFTAAGMVPFKAYYSSPDAAPYPTAVSVQKCLRAGGKQSDLENVGRTLRHHTFFEMLGNFSFGDYFKKEAIDTAWELSVDVWGIDRSRIWISVYQDDDEAFGLWAERIGIPKRRIIRLGKKDNFWGPVGDTGVCGPSSELHFDTGAERGCGKDTCLPGCECDRFIEFWNLVFPQFFFTEQGSYDPLPRPGIDTGMGLERVAFILQEVKDNFHTDLFLPVREAVKEALPRKRSLEKAEVAVNIASDHVRSLVFALSEGVMPSNEGRGYVLRRLLRRALTKMHPFGVKKPFLSAAVEAVTDTMGERYPEVLQRSELVKKVITAEEEHFLSTIEQGWNKFEGVIERSLKSKTGTFPGKDAFTLYDTFGFPLELTSELARDAGLEVDDNGYQVEMEKQKTRSRRQQSVAGTGNMRGEDAGVSNLRIDLNPVKETEFLGYDTLVCDANLASVESFGDAGEKVIEATTDRTVFYPQGGGQVGDIGVAAFGARRFRVMDTLRRGKRIVHRLQWADADDDVEPFFRSSPKAHLVVDEEARLSTARNHTATHLLHAALRKILGDHVAQAGSLVAPDRLRFDFHHFQPVTADEVYRVERMVNDSVLADMEVDIGWVAREQAFADGAMALFGEKYGETVRVVTIDHVSKELCGGTHLRRTGQIGGFVIRQETSVAAGVRRIEALTGYGASAYFKALVDERVEMARELKIGPEDLVRRVRALAEENERLKKTLGEREDETATSRLQQALQGAEDIGGVKLVTFVTESGTVGSLRRAGDYLRGKMDPGVGLLCLALDRKPVMLVISSDRLIAERGIKANEIASRIGDEFSLKGGGKPHMAQVGIADKKDFARIVSFVKSWLEGLT